MIQKRPSLKPTLWRTCRVLANRTRLRIFGVLAQQSPQSVSSVAASLHLPLPVASQSLRALEARGLLTVVRAGRRTHYSASTGSTGATPELIAPLRLAFQSEHSPVESLFKLSTAFTHPRRIEIFRVLRTQPATPAQIQSASRISAPALWRHLGKLETRGFVLRRGTTYWVTNPPDAFGRALALLAAE